MTISRKEKRRKRGTCGKEWTLVYAHISKQIMTDSLISCNRAPTWIIKKKEKSIWKENYNILHLNILSSVKPELGGSWEERGSIIKLSYG